MHFPSHPLIYKQSLSDNSATQKTGDIQYIFFILIFFTF
nr:MAG TPA: hypothetical protein [Bacteriophage sp.]